MDTVDIIGLLVPVIYFALLITERLWPAREFPPRPGWQWIGVGFLVLVMTISTVVPLLIPEAWLAQYRPSDGARLGVGGGTLVGIVVLEGVIYAWHRTVHNVGFLWRGFHQIQHSPQRVDIAGSLVFHPTEIVVQTLLQLAVSVIVLGLDPLAAALTGGWARCSVSPTSTRRCTDPAASARSRRQPAERRDPGSSRGIVLSRRRHPAGNGPCENPQIAR
jgi:sterol desaturase/sphingolipid hydroxylase (fatty acid hydroxylase superfamily)